MNEFENIMEMANILDTVGSAVSGGVSGFMAIIFAFVAVAGLFQCFFGYKLMRISFAICGFGIGALGGLIGVGSVVSEAAPAVIAALVCGVLCALLLFHVYRLGIFCMNFALCALLVIIIGGFSEESLISGLIAGLVVGIVSAIMVRIVTIISTAVGGGMTAGLAIGSILSAGPIGGVLAIVLAIAGVIFQFKTTGKKQKRAKSAPEVIIIPAAAAETGVEPVKAEPKAAAPRRESPIRPAFAAIVKAVGNIIKNLALCAAVSLAGFAKCSVSALKLKMRAYKPAH